MTDGAGATELEIVATLIARTPDTARAVHLAEVLTRAGVAFAHEGIHFTIEVHTVEMEDPEPDPDTADAGDTGADDTDA